MPIQAPVLFVGGLLYGMVADNHLSEISTCVTDGEQIVGDVSNIVAAIEEGSWFKAAKEVKTTALAFHTALTACEGMGDDIAAIESWASVFKSKTDLISTVTKHMLLHRKEIMGDVQTVKTDWNAGEYYQAGKASADLLTVAIGPIEVPTQEEAVDNLGISLEGLPKLAAGFLYGMVGDNHLTEIETCYSSTSPLFNYLDSALKDLEAFHIFSAIKEFELFVFHF